VCFLVLNSSQDHLGIGTHDLCHPISCRCKKHQQLVHQEGGFVACFSSRHSNGSLIHLNLLSPLVTHAFSQHQAHSRRRWLTQDLKWSSDRGTPHAIPEESPSENDLVLSEGESSGSPLLRARNTMIPVTPIMTTTQPEETPTF
jgi:hypothetical protein